MPRSYSCAIRRPDSTISPSTTRPITTTVSTDSDMMPLSRATFPDLFWGLFAGAVAVLRFHLSARRGTTRLPDRTARQTPRGDRLCASFLIAVIAVLPPDRYNKGSGGPLVREAAHTQLHSPWDRRMAHVTQIPCILHV